MINVGVIKVSDGEEELVILRLDIRVLLFFKLGGHGHGDQVHVWRGDS
jgi:uncharacterized protein (DUF4415 family)